MTDHSRRTFLAGAGVAATAVTVTALAPASAFAAADSAGDRDSEHGRADGSSADTLVAYVRDTTTGHITLMSGDREIEITDRALARRLARLAG